MPKVPNEFVDEAQHVFKFETEQRQALSDSRPLARRFYFCLHFSRTKPSTRVPVRALDLWERLKSQQKKKKKWITRVR